MLGPPPAAPLRAMVPPSLPSASSAPWVVLVAVGIAATGSHGALLTIARAHGTFTSSAVVLTQELVKLLVCVVVVWRSQGHGRSIFHLSKDWMLYLIPAICYAFNNNMAVYLQSEMDAATFHVLGNFKILTTAALYRLLLHRRLSLQKWGALCVLFLGSAVNAGSALAAERSTWDAGHLHVSGVGLAGMLVYCLVSGFAGVYSEQIMRRQMQASLYEQGIKMYSAGVLVNAALYLHTAHPDRPFFDGFSWAAWVIVMTQAANGLIFAYIMKYAGNILRLFVIAGAMLLATVLSRILFDLALTPAFLAALALVVAAIAIYFYDPSRPAAPPVPKGLQLVRSL